MVGTRTGCGSAGGLRPSGPEPARRVLAAADRMAGEVVELARELIKIPTENRPPTGDELRGQEFIAARFRELELEVDVFRPDDVPGLAEHPAYHPSGSGSARRNYRDRPNVVGRWRGSSGGGAARSPGAGLPAGRSLILTAHMDVVPPGERASWEHDPWAAELDDGGRIFGRGALDDKGPLAAMTMAIQVLKEAGVEPAGDVVLQSVVDEEFGGGNGSLATILRGYRADAVLSAEPSGMAICPTTLGCVSLSFTLEGRPAHGMEQWKAANPIDGAIDLIRDLPRWHRERNRRASAFPLIAERPVPLPLFVRAISAGTNLGGASIPSSCHVGMWLGIAPDERWVDVEAEAGRFVEQAAAGPDWKLPRPARFERAGRFLEGSDIHSSHPLCGVLERAYAEATGGGRTRYACGASGDLFLYTNYGHMPGLVCGPGDVSLAHAADESIAVADLVLATKVYALAICGWCGVAGKARDGGGGRT